MTNETLKGLKIAILIEEEFEQVEMVEPRKALDEAGAETRIVSPRNKHVRAWNFTKWGDEFPVDVALDQAKPQDFDALLLPGGVLNPDALRTEPKAVAFAKAFSMRASRWHRSATARGPSSRPARRTAGA